MAFVWLSLVSLASLHPPCTLYIAGNGSLLPFDNSIDAAKAGLAGPDVNGYFCPAGAGAVYDNSEYRPYVGEQLVSVYNSSTDTGYFAYGTPEYFPQPESSYTASTGSNPCDCYNEPLMWAAMHLPLSNPLAQGFVRWVEGKYPSASGFGDAVRAKGSPCDYVELGYTWRVSAANTDPVVLTIPPGKVQAVVIAGNGASSITKASDDNGPCGVVSLDPFQATGFALENPFLRPGTMPVSAYCTEPAVDNPYGFIENVVRHDTSTVAQLQTGFVEDAFGLNGNLPGTMPLPPGAPPTPPSPPPDTEFWNYNPNHRMFLQTLLRHLAIVDLTCQCRMGAVAALVAFSGVHNPMVMYNEYRSFLVGQVLDALATKLDTTSGFKAPNIYSDTGYRPDHIRMACPLLWVVKWACVSVYINHDTAASSSAHYCSTFQTQYPLLLTALGVSSISLDTCNGIYHAQIRSTNGETTPLTRQMQTTMWALFMCYGEESAFQNPILSSSGTVGTQNMTYSSDDCYPQDVTVRAWYRSALEPETAPPTSAPISSAPTQAPKPCMADGEFCSSESCCPGLNCCDKWFNHYNALVCQTSSC